MSMWTYASGVIEVDTYAHSNAEAMYIARIDVNHLPEISGSEDPVNYYLSLANGYNKSSTCDEFGQRSNLCRNKYPGIFTAQSIVLITVEGSLRNREFHCTLQETTKMLARLSSRLRVRSCLVAVRDGLNSFVFDNPEWVLWREQSDWTKDLLWSFTE